MSQTAELSAAYRYLNLLRNKPKRVYGFAYIAYLRNGAYGNEPDRGALSFMGAQAVRLQLAEILGPAPFVAVGAIHGL